MKSFCLVPFAAIFAAVAAAALLAAEPLHAQQPPQIAITFDDLPAHGPLPKDETREQIIDAIIAALKDADIPPAYGFVNGIQDDLDPSNIHVLEAWHAAGNLLGNHTWSHMNLNTSTSAAWEADVTKNDSLLAKETGNDTAQWHWLRFPFLGEGKDSTQQTEVRTWLASHGYHLAPVTMGFADYTLNGPYVRCSDAGNKAAMARLEDAYLSAGRQDAAYRRALAQNAFGHDIPYVLLVHVGALDAQMLPRLLAQYKSEGFRFITLSAAEAAPFYASDMDPSLPAGEGSLEAAAAATGKPFPKGSTIPDWVDSVCK